MDHKALIGAVAERTRLSREESADISRAVLEAANEDFGSLGNGGLLFAADEDGARGHEVRPVEPPDHEIKRAGLEFLNQFRIFPVRIE